MTFILRLFLMSISMIGTWEWLRRKTKVDVYFVPSLTIAVQVACLFAGGILNFLLETVVVLFVLGIISFFYYIYKKETRGFLSGYLKMGFVFLVAASLFMLITLRGKQFAHIDNFTHWATVVKEMLRNNRFPNFSDAVIGFPSYPLGSSSYIYYFSRVVGISESIQMFAQVYMMLTCLLPLFIFCKKNKIAVFLLICALTNFFFVYNIIVINLLVDTLLPLVSMCGFLFIYFYGRNTDQKESFYSCALYMIWIMQIKNSGIFFVVFMILGIFLIRDNNKNIRSRVLCACFPFLSLLLWQRHFGLVFKNAEKSKHAMTFTNYLNIFQGKNQTEFQEVFDHIRNFLIGWKDIYLLVLLILAGGFICCISKKEWQIYLKCVLFSFIMFFTYQIGLFGMYLFSMEGEELYLSVTERYDKTIVIAILYLLMTVIIKAISNAEINKYAGSAAALCLIVFILGFMKISQGEIRIAGHHYDFPPYYLYKRLWVEKHKNDFVMEDDDSYCVLVQNRTDGSFLKNILNYELYTGNTSYEVITASEMMDEVTQEFIFIYDENNEIIQDWVLANYPEQVGNQVIRRWDLYPSVN